MSEKFIFNPIFPNATDQQKWQQIRNWRNSELAQTDWTQLDDAPVNRIKWAEYRQKLRDIDDTKNPNDYVIPDKPNLGA